MQSLGDLFANNKILFVAILVIVLAVLGGLAAFASRTLFGRRINAGSNGRTRQPRLGVVDAFDLDRQRQLVIVRRDNVEHLLMIGGPNDLLIETAIVRAAAPANPMTVRDKDIAPTIAAPPVGAVTPFVAPQAPTVPPALPDLGKSVTVDVPQGDGAVPIDPPLPPDVVPTAPATAPRPAPPLQTPPRTPPFPPRPVAANAPAGGRSVFPPPRPAATPTTPRPLTTPSRPAASGALPPRPPVETKRTDDVPRPTVPSADENTTPEAVPPSQPVVEPIAAPPKPPMSALRPPRLDTARTDTPVRPPAPPIRPVQAPVPALPTAPAPVAPPPIKSLDALESLEEEMAKLLGRPVPPADKS